MCGHATMQTRASKHTTAEGGSESDLDYGRHSDDSDDDYEESTMLKPWQQQKGKKKQMSESSDNESMGADDDDQQMPKGSIETRTEDTKASLEDYYKVSIPAKNRALSPPPKQHVDCNFAPTWQRRTAATLTTNNATAQPPPLTSLNATDAPSPPRQHGGQRPPPFPTAIAATVVFAARC